MSRNDELWDLIYDKAKDYIEDKSRDTDLREEYWRAMSERRWKNSHFGDFVDIIVANIDEIEREYCGSGRSDRDALEDAIQDLVNGHFAMMVLANREASRGLSEKQYRQMKDAAEQFEDLCGDRRRSRGRDRDREDRDRDRDRGSYGERSRRSERDSEDYGARRDRDERPRRSKFSSANDPWAVLQALEDGHEDANRPEEVEKPRESNDEPAPPLRTREEPVRRVTAVEGPDFTRADPYGEFMKDGEHWLVSHRSSWTITDKGDSHRDILHQYEPEEWHDLNLYVKFHVNGADGIVREEFVPVTENNVYLNQELAVQRGEVPPESKGTGGISLRNHRPDVDLSITEEPAAPVRISLTEELGRATLVIPTITDSQPVDSLANITFAARTKLVETKASVGVYLGHIRTPLNASSWEQMDLIDQVRNSPTLSAAADKMIELEHQFDPSIFAALNKRFSTLVVRTLIYQFQFPAIKGMNFAKDYNRALGVVVNKRGDEFASLFGDRSRYLIKLACAYAARDEIADAVADLTTQGSEVPPTVVFFDFAEIISLDATLEQAGLDSLTDEKLIYTGASITAAHNKALLPAISKLHDTMMRSLPAPIRARMLLSTADNYLVEIIPYAARTESFVLTIVN